MFLSYDGGAVPASLDTLQELFHDSWSEFEIGALGATDKVGMVAASLPWGWALQRCNAKLLLSIALLVNALVTFIFGWLPNKALMFLVKFVMGATQSLQGVWATVWTVNMAPPDKKTMWLGLGAVSAGIGNGIGTCVAGFGTANGLPFAFAFQLAGGILASLWLLQLFFPARWLRMQLSSSEASPETKREDHAIRYAEERTEEAVDVPQELSVWAQLQTLRKNAVFVGTTLAISLAMFQVSGIQYLWTRAFTEIWMVSPDRGLSKNWVTAMFIIVTGGGGGLGIAFGSWFIDRSGGYHQTPGVLRSFRILWWYRMAAALAGIGGVGALYGKFHPWQYTSEWGDAWLWLCWFCIFVIYAAQNASVAALCGINLQVIPEDQRTFASGTEITIRNILGYIGGPLFPSIVMTLNSGWVADGWQLSLGLGFVMMANVLGVLVLGRLRLAASLELAQQRADVLQELRLALQSEDASKLERAVAAARRVELEQDKHGDGAAVLGMANELIGRFHVRGEMSPQAVPRRMSELEAEIRLLQSEILRQQEEIRRLQLLPASPGEGLDQPEMTANV